MAKLKRKRKNLIVDDEKIKELARLNGTSDHLADVLIVVSAARLKGAVVTLNVRHFETWAALANASGLDVAVTPFQP
jgi:hypothetical protein